MVFENRWIRCLFREDKVEYNIVIGTSCVIKERKMSKKKIGHPFRACRDGSFGYRVHKEREYR